MSGQVLGSGALAVNRTQSLSLGSSQLLGDRGTHKQPWRQLTVTGEGLGGQEDRDEAIHYPHNCTP